MEVAIRLILPNVPNVARSLCPCWVNCCEADPALFAAYGITCKWTSEELPGPTMIVCPPESNFERNSGVCSAPSGLVFQANSLYVPGGIPRRVNVPPATLFVCRVLDSGCGQ